MSSRTHTPTPWKEAPEHRIEAFTNGESIALMSPLSDNKKENLDFILKAVNFHEALLKALKEFDEEHSEECINTAVLSCVKGCGYLARKQLIAKAESRV